MQLFKCILLLALVSSCDSFARYLQTPLCYVSRHNNRLQSTIVSSSTNDESDGSTGKIISCETTGSCGSVRRAYKQELNDLREKKRQSSTPMEDDYLDMISGNKPAPKKSYNPFKKQLPPTVPPPL